MMRIYTTLLCFFCCVPFFAQEQWVLKKDKNDIKIYTKSVPESELKEFKVEMTVQSTINEVKDMIVDGDELHEWNYKTINSKLLKTPSENERIIWLALDLPWPVRNRDVVMAMKLRRISQNVLLITISSASHKYKELDDYLRITTFEGYWLLEQFGENLKITHQLHGDPGGNVPNWIINSTITRAPYHNFVALKERLQ